MLYDTDGREGWLWNLAVCVALLVSVEDLQTAVIVGGIVVYTMNQGGACGAEVDVTSRAARVVFSLQTDLFV